MNADEIRSLLEKFYDGLTTEQEEQELRRMMNGQPLPPELQEEQAFFSRCHAQVDVPQGLEERLSRQIDKWNMVEKNAVRRSRRIGMRWFTGVAACMLVVFGAVLLYQAKTDREEFARRQAEQEEMRKAYAEAHRGLQLFSKYLNKGLDLVGNNDKED